MGGWLKRLVVVLALAVLMLTATAVGAAGHPAPGKKHDHPSHHGSKPLHQKHATRKHGHGHGHGHTKPHHHM
ncbi:hypothetical protein ABZP36_021522 [Zizania latifolia]